MYILNQETINEKRAGVVFLISDKLEVKPKVLNVIMKGTF